MTGEFNTLITSGAYVGEEMQAEFGRIPPAFLPVGSAYLIQHQLRRLTGRARKWLSLPADYVLAPAQERLLSAEGIRIVRVDPAKSLGISVFQSILEIDPGRPLEILHGDTLVLCPRPPSLDVVSVGPVAEQYRWGLVETDGRRITAVRDGDRSDTLTEETLILSGYFVFRDAWRFVRCLVSRDFRFTGAIDEYAAGGGVLADGSIETLDFGHQKTFYRSRKTLAAARHFNSIGIDDYFVTKRSADRRKIDAEAHWLRSVPGELQPFTARLVEDGAAGTPGEYRTLYSTYPTVAELYLAQSSRLVWRRVLDSCIDFLTRARRHEAPDRSSPFSWLVVEKLHQRIGRYPGHLPAPDAPLTINGHGVGGLDAILERLEQAVERAPGLPPCIMHGDFCFANMLYDLRNDRIVLIDPRGLVADEVTLFGDTRYDIAKLGHSIIGRYDQIVGEHLVGRDLGDGAFVLEIPADPLRDWLEAQFLSEEVDGIPFDSEAVRAAMVSLFLAMIPLHADSPARQTTLFANALRLYGRFFRDGCLPGSGSGMRPTKRRTAPRVFLW